MDISTIRRSVVAVRASVPEDAFTAGTLGTLREGSGVVISPNGLVLTIGYLLTEADEVWLTRHDGKVIAGHALAYDQETASASSSRLRRSNCHRSRSARRARRSSATRLP